MIEKLILSTGILALALLSIYKVRRMSRILMRNLDERTAGYVSWLSGLLSLLVLSFALLLWFEVIGVDMSSIVAGLGLVGFGIGFALKDLISNSVSGLMLLVFKPFGVGDSIEVKGLRGRVTEINLRYTILESSEGRILIPNSLIFKEAVRLLSE